MARISYFDFDKADGEAGGYLRGDRVRPRRTNHARLYAHSPFISGLFSLFRGSLRASGCGSVLSARIKEFVVIKTSHMNSCDYCYAHNTAMGEAMGISHEQVLAIGSDDYMISDLLSPREKAATLWAEHVTRNTAKDRDDVFAEVSKHFDEREIFELTLVCGLFNMTNRVHDSLQIDLDPPEVLSKASSTETLTPEKLRSNVERVLNGWPDFFPEPNPD